MGKSNGRKVSSKSLIPTRRAKAENPVMYRREGKEKFFACYLLTSLCQQFKGQTYIGFTVNPRRRIRQHNGEIRSGAWRTKRKRPWEMVLCIYGFPTNVAALQFEWAWQHPLKSLAVRAAAASFKSVSGLHNKIKVAHAMLSLPAWQSLSLTMNFFSTKYQTYISGCPALPDRMRTQVCSMDELPCYSGIAYAFDELECDEDFHLTGSFCASTMEESRMAMRACQKFPSNQEENAPVKMSHRDDSCCAMNEHSDETSREQMRSSTSSRESNPGKIIVNLDDDHTLTSSVELVEDGLKSLDRELQKQSAAALLADTESVSTKCPGTHQKV